MSEEEAVIEAERKRQAEQDAAIQAKLNESETLAKNNKRKSSMFGDIKEVLKAVELTKKQIDMNAAQTMRERENKLANILSSVASGDQNERLRMKKLVDGCINAISTDVKVYFICYFISNLTNFYPVFYFLSELSVRN